MYIKKSAHKASNFYLILICIMCCFIPIFVKADFIEDSWLKNKVEIDPNILNYETSYRHRVLKNFNFAATNVDKVSFDILNSRKSIMVNIPYVSNPQSFFFFQIGQQIILGKKYLSDLVVYQKLPGLFCSLIKAEMILGIFERDRITQDGIIVYYKPLALEEKVILFQKLIQDRTIDIWYPYTQLIGLTKEEKATPKEGWIIDEERAKLLGLGEQEIRKYTIKFLQQFTAKNGLKGKKIYDPACSTGEFLATIKAFYPEIHAIGQELSKSMVQMAKPKLDEVYWGDSIKPAVRNNSVDFIFFRFLNGEVVSTHDAQKLFIALSKTVKKKGYLIILGHTPILLDIPWLQSLGFKILQANGISEDGKAVFQYYVLQKILK
jgi:isonocardicin synthase